MAVLVVSKIDMVRCRWCWSMLVGEGIMLIKSRVDSSRESWEFVTLSIISCVWNCGKSRGSRCFNKEGGWWLAKVGCRASLVEGRWFRVLISVA